MKLLLIKEVYENNLFVNQTIKIFGWVRNRRHSKAGISFIDIYDGSCINTIQVLIRKNILNYDTEVLKLSIGCSICVIGKLIYSLGKKQRYEIQVKKINVFGWVDQPEYYPISSKKCTNKYLRKIPHLKSRTNLISVITRLRNEIFYAMHDYLRQNNYFWVSTPIITSLNAEGAGAMFRVSTLNFHHLPINESGKVNFQEDFFGKESFLTVSGQLTAESYACSMKKVYTFGPIFRAENSNTTRHLSEFWMLEIEESFTDLNDIILISENLIKHIIRHVLDHCVPDINFLYQKIDLSIFQRLEKFILNKITQIEYFEAIEILQRSKDKFLYDIQKGDDLSSDHEKYLVNHHFRSPIFIKNYPKNLKSFYMRMNKDKETVSAMDLLLPNIGEVIGGSQREERISVLKKRILELQLNIKDYDWYLDLRRYGTVPHSGFGLGFERLLSYITGIKNVKDLIPFPRTVNNLLC
ncbi:asparagine--tRNA ligase [Buchnera aphidicola]|uniref:asparagine--tRNA ligase n=1 Tax=Buchnera aphidicola TaxID=9 RepID=UPI0031B89B97